jgi:hypothetical protein
LRTPTPLIDPRNSWQNIGAQLDALENNFAAMSFFRLTID